MKLFSKILSALLLFSIGLFTMNVSAGWLSDLWSSSEPSIPYCQWSDKDDCTLKGWVEITENINSVVTGTKASDFIQNITSYVLGFMSIVAVLYIIYAGFNILTWNWDEDKVKKSKSIITYVIMGVIIMFLAYSIVAFLFTLLDSWDATLGINTQSQTFISNYM